MIKRYKINKKSEKGITGIDIVISIIIVIIFTGLIANMMYKTYKESIEVQKVANADAYATIIIEKIDEKPFETIDNNFLTTYKDEIDINSGYTAKVEVANNDDSSEEFAKYKIDNEYLFKKVTVTISYDNNEISINKLKVRELNNNPYSNDV